MPTLSRRLRDAIERAQNWPSDRQDEAARKLDDMASQHAAAYRLTDGEVAEIKRRLAEPAPTFMTIEEVRARFMRRPP